MKIERICTIPATASVMDSALWKHGNFLVNSCHENFTRISRKYFLIKFLDL